MLVAVGLLLCASVYPLILMVKQDLLRGMGAALQLRSELAYVSYIFDGITKPRPTQVRLRDQG